MMFTYDVSMTQVIVVDSLPTCPADSRNYAREYRCVARVSCISVRAFVTVVECDFQMPRSVAGFIFHCVSIVNGPCLELLLRAVRCGVGSSVRRWSADMSVVGSGRPSDFHVEAKKMLRDLLSRNLLGPS
jgi:hypothetical protein